MDNCRPASARRRRWRTAHCPIHRAICWWPKRKKETKCSGADDAKNHKQTLPYGRGSDGLEATKLRIGAATVRERYNKARSARRRGGGGRGGPGRLRQGQRTA